MLLYTHIPFCEGRCHYCSFFSLDFGFEIMGEYFEALTKQFLFEVDRLGLEKNSIKTLYIGGGTPSLAPAYLYERYIEVVLPYLVENIEFSCEANPNSITKEWLKEMRSLGLNRLSIGVQSFSEEKLKFLGRIHTAKDVFEAVESAKNIGIENISLDLIYESALDNLELLQRELDAATALPITHISAYSLTIESNSAFESSSEKAIKDDEQAYFLRDFLNERGFLQYEVSNFGKECAHNIGYWEHKPYLGIGAGAVGCDNSTRRYVVPNTNEYLKEPTKCRVERLKDEDIRLERIFLGLRSRVGFEKELLCQKELKNYEILCKEAKLRSENGTVYCMDYYLADSILLFLLQK